MREKRKLAGIEQVFITRTIEEIRATGMTYEERQAYREWWSDQQKIKYRREVRLNLVPKQPEVIYYEE